MHFRKISQCRLKQLTLNKLLVKKARKATAEEEESTASKRQRREKRQMENYQVFLWKGTPLKKVCRQIKYKIMLIIMHYYRFTILYMDRAS